MYMTITVVLKEIIANAGLDCVSPQRSNTKLYRSNIENYYFILLRRTANTPYVYYKDLKETRTQFLNDYYLCTRAFVRIIIVFVSKYDNEKKYCGPAALPVGGSGPECHSECPYTQIDTQCVP